MQGTEYGGEVSTRTERRGRPRVTVAVPFRLYSADERLLLTARTLDLSTGGALLHGNCKAAVGEPVRIEISRGAARNPLRLHATVVRFCDPDRTRRNHGVAVRFDELGALDETVLNGIIRDARG
ncbi:MAG: PilZ domain-containing protein [Myxococcota bacterium]